MSKRSAKKRKRRPTRTAPADMQAASKQKTVDLAAEYQYVIEDLQRIGIIAAILIGTLVILKLFW